MVPIKNLIIVFASLLVTGTVLTIPLFKFDYHKFFHSSLFKKIIFWAPIFIVFVGLLYAGSALRLLVLVILLAACLAELLLATIGFKDKAQPIIFFSVFAIGLSHLGLLAASYPSQFVNLLITLCLATVLADVTAFFFGNYLGKHKLPEWLNKNKSWEGVLGEILGSFIGVLIVDLFVMPVISIWLFVPIGIGAALGDLANSYTKRKLDIKDWSRAIPGHGGFTDRLSSIAGSAILLYYFLKLTNLI